MERKEQRCTERVGTARKLKERIGEAQLSFLGHIVGKHGLENRYWSLGGNEVKIDRPRLNFVRCLGQNTNVSEIIKSTGDGS